MYLYPNSQCRCYHYFSLSICSHYDSSRSHVRGLQTDTFDSRSTVMNQWESTSSRRSRWWTPSHRRPWVRSAPSPMPGRTPCSLAWRLRKSARWMRLRNRTVYFGSLVELNVVRERLFSNYITVYPFKKKIDIKSFISIGFSQIVLPLCLSASQLKFGNLSH